MCLSGCAGCRSSRTIAGSDNDLIFLAIHLDNHGLRQRQRTAVGAGSFGLALCQVGFEIGFGLARLVGTILLRVHCQLEQLLLVLAKFPIVVRHFFAEDIESVRIGVLRIAGKELTALLLRLFDEFRRQFARQLARLAQHHVPDVVGNHRPALLALLHLHDVHKCHVLNVLAKRRNQAWIAHHRPDVSYFVKKLDQELVLRHERQVVFGLVFID